MRHPATTADTACPTRHRPSCPGRPAAWPAELLLAVLAAVAWLAIIPPARAHPDKVEDRLLTHFATGTHPVGNGVWPDVTHTLEARVQGSPILTNLGPAQALVFRGDKDWLLVAPSVEAAQPVLPKREFSVAAWVLLDETRDDGGIAGLIQDNGDFEKGWLLGFDRRSYAFTLCTTGADDGNGRLTRLRGRTPVTRERWAHVVGTYDGTTMRLYVNGELDGESTAQSGDILYPATGRYAVAAYVDDDELNPMEGAIYEVKVYGRVLAQAEITEAVEKNRGLLDWKPPVNQDLQFVVKPYLQRATRDAISIMAETTQPARMSVQYGEVHPFTLTQGPGNAEPSAIQEVRLEGLKPFTRYFYRVFSTDAAGNQARSDVFSFQTLPGPGDAWAFGILGDTQRNPTVTGRAAEGIFALRPNFLLHVGDVVDDGFAKQQWVLDLFAPCARLFAYVPTFPVIGNHEKNSHWYYDYFSLPDPEYFYTFTCGNAEFFMIDSNKDCRPGSDQEWAMGSGPDIRQSGEACNRSDHGTGSPQPCSGQSSAVEPPGLGVGRAARHRAPGT
jgi:hypothetical protein